ncbi:IclR family transcriptional regulator C-terminal domain-containing protein [Tardiphaga sp.]|uniref:IclR family transcriptional regulator domain-containing protein n=1 Tax=Tardiphaga sp. TaxID=1926292 RepID=UPI00262134F9|nr:IclR family transcriptional regulator C-terminal domain-containing protein [Tardiphaga sp.]MDB5619713.1 Regulatory protein PcaR [Tardiphaga sp.]
MLTLDEQWTDITRWPSGSDEFVESFAKGLLVIATFSQERTLTLTGVSKRANLSRAGARRLLHTLVELGMARRDGDAFSLSPRVLQLGFAYLSSLSLREAAQPIIEILSREANEVVAISVLDGINVTYITRAEVTSVLRHSLTIGSRIPAFCTSMGRALLAGLPPEECTATLAASDRRAWTRLTVTDISELEREIATVREQGWSLVTEELEIGAFGIAAPIRDAAGKTVAAINLSTNLARHTPAELVQSFLPQLIKASEQIGSHLV